MTEQLKTLLERAEKLCPEDAPGTRLCVTQALALLSKSPAPASEAYRQVEEALEWISESGDDGAYNLRYRAECALSHLPALKPQESVFIPQFSIASNQPTAGDAGGVVDKESVVEAMCSKYEEIATCDIADKEAMGAALDIARAALPALSQQSVDIEAAVERVHALMFGKREYWNPTKLIKDKAWCRRIVCAVLVIPYPLPTAPKQEG